MAPRTTVDTPNPEVVRSWRHLVADVATRLSWGSPERDEEVVLDTVLDGVRYSLVRRAVAEEPLAGEPLAPLSAREREIARMVAKGYTNKTMAAVLGISPWTVDTHLRRIYRKLAVSSRSAMVTRLARTRVLSEQDTPEWSEAWRARVAAGGGVRRAG